MRASSTAYPTATTNAETEPVTFVAFTWPADPAYAACPTDLSGAVQSISPSADITTDLPPSARLVSGYPARSAQMTLSGVWGADETDNAMWLFDSFSTQSPLYGLDWTGVSGPLVTIEQGLNISTPIPAVYLPIDPTFEGGVAGWTGYAAAVTSSTTHISQGTKAMLATWAGGGQGSVRSDRPPMRTVPGVTYTVTADVYIPAGHPQVTIFASGVAYGQASTVTGAFQTLTVVFTAVATTTFIGFSTGNGAVSVTPTAGQQMWVDNMTYTQSAETFRQFTGWVDNCFINRSNGEVLFTLRDNRSKFDTTPTLPPAVANPHLTRQVLPGITAQWPMDMICRANGVYTSPPQRPNSLWYLSGHSSIWPDQGTIDRGSTIFGGTQDPATGLWSGPVFVPNKWGSALVPASFTTVGALASSGVVMANGNKAYLEFSIDVSNLAAANGVLLLTSVSTATNADNMASNVGRGNDWVQFQGTVLAGNLYTTVNAGQGDGNVLNNTVPANDPGAGQSGAAVTGTPSWHTFGCLLTFNGTSIAVQVWHDQTLVFTGAFNNNTTTGLPPAPASAPLATINCFAATPSEGWQVTTEAAPGGPAIFDTPTAYLDPSLNTLTAIPLIDTSTDAWTHLQRIAQAELGMAGLDEDGTFRFRNRYNTPTSAGTVLTSTTRLKEVGYEVNEANRARQITVQAQPLGIGPAGVIWAAQNATLIPARKTVTVFAALSAPGLFVPSGFTPIPSGGLVTFASNGYRAARTPAGGGAVAGSTLNFQARQITASTVIISMQNKNPFPVWVVSPTTLTDVQAGSPMLQLVGQLVQATIPPGAVTQTLSSNGKVQIQSTYGNGVPNINLPDNEWGQDPATEQQLTDDILGDMVRPRPMFTYLTVIGDARLQLGDRVTVVEQGDLVDGGFGPGAPIADDLIVYSVHPTIDSSGGFIQAIGGRTWASPRQWVLGIAGKSELGATTWI